MDGKGAAVDLKARLEALHAAGGASQARRRRAPPPPFSPAIDDVMPGAWEDGGCGPAFVARRVIPLADRLGPVTPGDFLEVGPEWLGFLAALDGARPAPAEVTFLDVETTGLCGGTGTVAFMVGLARFAADGLHVIQLFLPDYDGEAAMLALLARLLPAGGPLVTFNGRSFDWPILETRFLLSRMAPPRTGPHIDLLWPARRLWRERLGECSLQALEAGVLGLGPRDGDVPGYLIPDLYFDYLRRRDASGLPPVFEHNRRDLLSMVALATIMTRRVADPLRPPPPPADLLSLGRIFERAGDWDRSIACYRAAAGAAGATSVAARARERAAAAHKRAGRFAEAADLWRAALQAGPASLLPYIELAKHLEHRARDLVAARDVVLRALQHVEACAAFAPGAGVAAGRAALLHRLQRLNRRIALLA
jgi:hypothetical protein